MTIIGEGLDGYGAALDAIADQMSAEGIFLTNSWYVDSGGLPTARCVATQMGWMCDMGYVICDR